MDSIAIRVSGMVGAQPMAEHDEEMLVVCGTDRVYLKGDRSDVRAFAEAVLMACPPPRIVRVKGESGMEVQQ